MYVGEEEEEEEKAKEKEGGRKRRGTNKRAGVPKRERPKEQQHSHRAPLETRFLFEALQLFIFGALTMLLNPCGDGHKPFAFNSWGVPIYAKY
ncbi:hypothetical protein DPV78_010942 [Talaromyces pinophilus]|nr:hypothetical protein DPV78_010942 [Talaromyces pinophilus]